jgi:hypothetical protein
MQDLSVGGSLEIYCRAIAQSESMSSLFSRAAKQQRATCQFPKREIGRTLRDLPPISTIAIPRASILIEQAIHFFRNTILQRRSLVRQINAARLCFHQTEMAGAHQFRSSF